MATLSFIIDAQNRAGQAIKEVESQVKGLEGKVKDMQPVFQKMALVGTATFTAVVFGVKKAVDSASEFEGISTDFARMTQQVGMDGDKLIEKLNEVSMGTVSNTNLMLSSNRAMALGVGNNMEDITTLMEIARLKGRALGLDTTQAFNDIVTGIGRGSPLILDNLGIMIKHGEAQEQYARQLGKTVEELTDAEKSQAIFNAVMKSGKKDLEEAGPIALSFGERMQQVKKETADASVSLGQAFLPILEDLAKIVVPLINNIAKFTKENKDLVKILTLVTLAVSGLVAIVGTLGLILPPIIAGIGAMGAVMAFILSPAGLVIAIIGALITAGVLLYQNWDKVVNGVKTMWQSLVGFFNDIFSSISRTFQNGINGLLRIMQPFINAFETVKSGASWIGSQAGGVLSGAGNFIGGLLGGGQFGIDNIPRTGMYMLHRGEQVVPAGSGTGGGITVNINGGYYLSEQVAEDLGDKIIDQLKRQMKI